VVPNTKLTAMWALGQWQRASRVRAGRNRHTNGDPAARARHPRTEQRWIRQQRFHSSYQGGFHAPAGSHLRTSASHFRLSDELPIGVPAKQRAESLEITSSRMGRLLDVLAAAHRQLGFDEVAGGDAVFEQLVTARIIGPTSKQDAARVLAEAGVRALSYRTVKRRLPGYARQEWRNRLSGACAARAALRASALVAL
jgi:hypothetical protein